MAFRPLITGIMSSGASTGGPWLISSASYDSVFFSVSSQMSSPFELVFSTDGTKMFVLGGTNDRIYRYTLSTAWDISTASYDGIGTSFDSDITSFAFKPDGTKIFILDQVNDNVFSLELTTSWDTGAFNLETYQEFSFSSQSGASQGIFFKPDGTKMYMYAGSTSNSVYQYTLSTAWNITTATYDSVSFSLGSQLPNLSGIFIGDSGTKLYGVGGINDSVYQYTMSTAWDLSTASYDSVSFNVNAQDSNPTAVFFKPDGTKMYITGSSLDRVYQYSVG